MILADNGSPWFLSGAPDDRWDNTVLRELRRIVGAAVDSSWLMLSPTTAETRRYHSGVLNAASFQPGPIVVGGLLSFVWPGVSEGGVTVLFDGTEAEVLYSSDGRVNVVVPELAGDSAMCEIRHGGSMVFREMLPVAEAAPGVFRWKGFGGRARWPGCSRLEFGAMWLSASGAWRPK